MREEQQLDAFGTAAEVLETGVRIKDLLARVKDLLEGLELDLDRVQKYQTFLAYSIQYHETVLGKARTEQMRQRISGKLRGLKSELRLVSSLVTVLNQHRWQGDEDGAGPEDAG